MRNVALIASFVMVLLSCAQPVLAKSEALSFELIKTRSHPNLAFTQGLIMQQQEFIESSGLYKQSYIQRYPVEETHSGPAQIKHLSKSDFAEGIANTEGKLWLITWQQGLARQYRLNDLQQTQSIQYQGEGWGLTFDGHHLLMSNGTATLSKRNPDNFSLITDMAITLNGQALTAINELEFAHGLIWANVWFSNSLYAIAPNTGKVIASLDLTPLIAMEKKLHSFGLKRDSVLNGIAYDAEADALWVTGKRWRKMYLIKPDHWPTY